MKKIMFAAAVAACVSGAYADACTPEKECPITVARVYQVQMNVYTTKGVMQKEVTSKQESACAPGESSCLVMRGKDKTVLRGYVYICSKVCGVEGYAYRFADVRRGALFAGDESLTWQFCNAMGARSTDAEAKWDFFGTINYDDPLGQGETEGRIAEYTLTGAGYGKYVDSTEGYFDNFSGYFAGFVSASYDLKSKYFNTAKADEDPDPCNCKPSQVLKCEDEVLVWDPAETVAFGAWKMKFNANVTKEYILKGETIFPSLLRKMFK